MFIRKYRPEDVRILSQLFYHTVHTVNAKDYTPKQRNAWADGKVDLEKWNQSFLEHHTFVAVELLHGKEKITGFGDIDDSGYLDRLYVHKDYQGMGIGKALCRELEAAVASKELSTHASITARPFFEKLGYQVVREQQVERKGVLLSNYVMEKHRGPR